MTRLVKTVLSTRIARLPNVVIALAGASALMALSGAAVGQTSQNQYPATTGETQTHVDAARKLAGDDLRYLFDFRCRASMPPQAGARPAQPERRSGDDAAPPATKVTDNLYYVGGADVASWALNTPEGIILFDALDNEAEARDIIVKGLERLDLAPRNIKYVVVMHGHFDHFGGAAYLQKTYGAKVWMSAEDWVYSARDPVNIRKKAVNPARDHDVADGETLSLGGTKVKLYKTPGHTPGSISALIPTTVNGKPHVLGLWGGTGVPREPAGQHQYGDSLARFMKLSADAGVDGHISNHAHNDNSLVKMAQMRAAPSMDNPFILGTAGSQRYLGVLNECALAGAGQPATAGHGGE